MRIFPTKFEGLTLLCLLISTLISCSKDSDLLADYVTTGNHDGKFTRFVVNDSFYAYGNQSIRLDVLANDIFPNRENVGISRTSIPNNGSVSINEDNSLTYTPIGPQTTTDSFTYTTQVLEDDNSITEETGTVTVIAMEEEKALEMGELCAFPGAQGFGKYATGGRGGTVVEVTNLNDDGPGSFRDALLLPFPRTIVFKVSGTINCNSYLKIPENAGNVTVAGQTAPGGGIQIKGAEFRIQGSNVILRHLRIRPGSSVPFNGEGQANDALRIIAYNGNHTENVIIDHCSLYWGRDENVEIGGIGTESKVSNVSVQNCIIAENIGEDHQFAFLLWNRATNISVYNNLFAHHTERSITSTTPDSSFEMINNLVYSFQSGTHFTYQNIADIIGNSYITNPSITTRNETIRLQTGDGILEETKAYIMDNRLDGGSISISNNGVNDLSDFLTSVPNFESSITPIPSDKVKSVVLSKAGASLQRDAADVRIVANVSDRNGGLINHENEVGGYPTIEKIQGYKDEDHDGIADDWEILNGLDPSDGADGIADRDDDGYTNLEEFLHFLTL